jgi:hypothetical protein
MISYIYRIAKAFEDLHGYPPNMLYLSNGQLNMLKLELGNPANVQQVIQQLGMYLIVSQSATHPSVSYTHHPRIYDDAV